MAVFEGLSTLRFLQDTETDHKSPGDEELMSQVRELFEVLFLLLFKVGSGTLTSDPPNDTTGYLIDTAAGFADDEHNEHTVVLLDGEDKLGFYEITDTEAANNRIECSGENFYAKGIRSGDSYIIFYDLINSTLGHDHDGINSKSAVLADDVITQAKIHSAAVGQTELKTSSGSVSNGGNIANHTLPGGEYGFYPQIKKDVEGAMDACICNSDAGNIGTSYVTNITLFREAANTAYAQQRYVTASGEVFWVFILRDKITKNVLSMWQSPDHPCFGNGNKPKLCPHPFGSYDPAIHEIVVINPSKEETLEMRKATVVEADDRPDRDLLQVIAEDYEIDESSNPDWPSIPVTVGLPRDWEEAWLQRRNVRPIKKVIPQPEGVMVRELRKRV